MKFLSLIILLFSFSVFAQNVVVETNPRDPVKGEPFQILFKCQTSANSEPEITFEAEGFEVTGKQSQGVSTRTIYQNGKIQTFRELLISYEAVAPKAGRVNLRNLVVMIEGKRLTQAVVPIQVLEAALEPKHVFVVADVPKKSVYVGEGITVRYQIYARAQVQVQSYDLKKFPNLTGFMKRFIQENNDVSRVTVDGEIFRRSVIYTARVYPEKSGKLTIDPIEIAVTYGSDPFSAFGLGFGSSQMKTRTLHSDAVEIDVKPLPTAGRPASFSGLVGRHQFDLKAARAQILVNEPVEARVSVSGPGNLESFEAPVLWAVPQLEKFDAKADLNISGTDAAIKTFDYTYLGKAPGEVPAREVEFSYFDPSSERYEVIRKKLPEILVGGSAVTAPAKPNTPATEPEAKTKPENRVEVMAKAWANPVWWLSALAIILAVGLGYRGSQWLKNHRSTLPSWEVDLKQIEKHGPTSAQLTRILHSFAPDSTRLLSQILADSRLPKESQDYFLQLLMQLERREFATKRPPGDIVVDKKHLHELRKALKGV